MDIKSRIRVRNIVNGFEVSMQVIGAVAAKHLLQNTFEHLQSMWIIGQSKFTEIDAKIIFKNLEEISNSLVLATSLNQIV